MPGKTLNVVDRGSFFEDPFFKDSWADFDSAMQRMMHRFDSRSTDFKCDPSPEGREVFRHHRSTTNDNEMQASQAIQVEEKDGTFQAILDVKDFNPKDLQVRAVDEKIVVEGRYDVAADDGKTSSSKAFYREFLFPDGADVERVSTALSKDGILTIKAPKKEGAQASLGSQITPGSPPITSCTGQIPRVGNESYASDFKRPHQGCEPYQLPDHLAHELQDKLSFSDSKSPRGYVSPGSHTSPKCSSPLQETLPGARVSSTVEFNTGSSSPRQRSEVIFSVADPQGSEPVSPRLSFVSPKTVSKLGPNKIAAVGSGGTASVSIKEEDGKRTVTSENTSVVQQKDGFLESKETTAETKDKDSQAARREAFTRMKREEEDPEGRFKHAESADASDLSESCVKQLPDGSVVTVKKSSTSSSNVKQSFSASSGQMPSLTMDSAFPSDFSDFRSRFGRGPSLIPQMSSDSLASNLSSRSGFTDLSSFSRFSDMSSFSNPFSSNSMLEDMDRFPKFTDFPSRFRPTSTSPNQESPFTNSSRSSRSFSSNTSSLSQSSFPRSFDKF